MPSLSDVPALDLLAHPCITIFDSQPSTFVAAAPTSNWRGSSGSSSPTRASRVGFVEVHGHGPRVRFVGVLLHALWPTSMIIIACAMSNVHPTPSDRPGHCGLWLCGSNRVRSRLSDLACVRLCLRTRLFGCTGWFCRGIWSILSRCRSSPWSVLSRYNTEVSIAQVARPASPPQVSTPPAAITTAAATPTITAITIRSRRCHLHHHRHPPSWPPPPLRLRLHHRRHTLHNPP